NAPTMGRTVGTYHGIWIRKFTNATRALPSVVSTTTAGVAHAGLRMPLAIAPSSLGWTLTRYGRMAVAFDRYRRRRGGAGLSGAGPRTRRGGRARLSPRLKEGDWPDPFTRRAQPTSVVRHTFGGRSKDVGRGTREPESGATAGFRETCSRELTKRGFENPGSTVSLTYSTRINCCHVEALALQDPSITGSARVLPLSRCVIAAWG